MLLECNVAVLCHFVSTYVPSLQIRVSETSVDGFISEYRTVEVLTEDMYDENTPNDHGFNASLEVGPSTIKVATSML